MEHSLACQYLFAAFSLKQSAREGVTEAQLEMIKNWRRQINLVARQEMLHLGLVSNLLMAIGGAPYFRRANFPQTEKYTTLNLRFMLSGFSLDTLKRFVCFEKPRGPGPWTAFCADAAMQLFEEPIVPVDMDYRTIGQL